MCQFLDLKAYRLVTVVQGEMTKISLLKADILRTHLVFKDLSVLMIESRLQNLDSWHERLPPRTSFEEPWGKRPSPTGATITVLRAPSLPWLDDPTPSKVDVAIS